MTDGFGSDIRMNRDVVLSKSICIKGYVRCGLLVLLLLLTLILN